MRRLPRFSSVECAPREPADVARVLDDGDLQPEADAEVRHLLLARELDGRDLAFDAALAEAAGHEDRVDVVQARRALVLDVLGLHVEDVDARARPDARVAQRLGQRHVRVAQVDVLADHRDRDLGLGMGFGVDDGLPLREIRRPRVELQLVDDVAVEALLGEQHRDLVDVVDVDGRDDGALLDVREQRDLRALLARQRVLRAAHEHVGLDADRRAAP